MSARASAGPVEALRALDTRMIETGTRLAVANAALCPDRQWQAGFAIHDLSQYSRAGRAEAAAAFGLGDGPGVLALAPRAAAARAGLRTDDILLTADGAALPRPPRQVHGSFAPTERIIEAIEIALADGNAVLGVLRGGAAMTITVTADQGCASRFQVVPSRRLDARADGRYVQLTSAMVEYASGEAELAAFVAHELAHNILRHRARLNAAGVRRGLLAEFGRNARLFREVELQADRLGVHLMARAGYDPRAAVRLWARQSRDRRFASVRASYPPWATRIAAMQAEISRIEQANAAGATAPIPVFPNRLGEGGPR